MEIPGAAPPPASSSLDVTGGPTADDILLAGPPPDAFGTDRSVDTTGGDSTSVSRRNSGHRRGGRGTGGGGSHLGYMPALDGVRAAAVIAVMGYHGGVFFQNGGFFSLDAFFVLSGFLITSLLVNEAFATNRIALRAFWARRARRLLPALLVIIIAVALYARFVATPGSYPDLRADAFSTLFYVANWHFIVAGQNYFVQTGPPSPLLPTWSLAVEEQFYIVWPIVVVLVLKVTRSKTRPLTEDGAVEVHHKSESRALWTLLGVSVAGATASAIEMAALFHPGEDATRVYFGSDTHAQSLLIGTGLACAVALWRRRGSQQVTSRWATWLFNVIGVGGAAFIGYAWTHLEYGQNFVFRGGFVVVSLSVAAVLTSAVLVKRGIVGTVLSFAPLRYIGKISYGMYLWHFPLDIALDEQRVGFGGFALFGVRAGATVAIATASYYAIEKPIRTGTFFTSVRGWIGTPVAVAGTAAVLLFATAVPAVAAAPPDAKAQSTRLAPAPATGPGATLTAALRRDIAPYATDPVRVLVVGDSVALTLAQGLYHEQSPYKLDIYNEGIIGCGIAVGSFYEDHGTVTESGAPCSPKPARRGCFVFKRSHVVPCISWEEAWREWLGQLHPNVVVLLAGRWEMVNRTDAAGKWTNILNPEYAKYIEQQLETAVRIGTSSGARMVIETTPCYSSGEQPNGAAWPEDSNQRAAVYNGLVRTVAKQFPRSVTVQNLDSVVCPSGVFEPDLHGVPVRSADGVHFVTPQSNSSDQVIGGAYLAPSLLPLWETLGHIQEASTRGRSVVRGPQYNPFFLAQQ